MAESELGLSALSVKPVHRLEDEPFAFYTVDTHTDLGINDYAEKSPSDFTRLFEGRIILPLIGYVIFWCCVGMIVRTRCWMQQQEGIRRKRLVNVTVSLIHSSLSGAYIFGFFLCNTHLMFGSPIHYYSYRDAHVVMFCVGYFIYDAIDLLLNDKLSIGTGVLYFHHLASIFVLSIPLVSHKFLIYAYWALLMEVSSIFLHARSILYISKLNAKMIAVTRFVVSGNLAAFVVFRFAVQFWQITYLIYNRHNVHMFYVYVGCLGGGAFLLINIGLFLRILHSDGLLCTSSVSRKKLDALIDDNEYTPLSTDEDDSENKKEQIA